jgi:DegV family protein with EDD domain
MCTYRIVTDSCCDFTREQYEKLNLIWVPLTLRYKGEEMDGFTEPGELHDFYEGIRSGEMPTTAAVNPDTWAGAMETALQKGQDVLCMTFTSALSTTHQSAVIAADELREKYPERKIIVVDTLCAALGQGLLVYKTCEKRDEGYSLEQLHSWVEENKLHICHWVTVDDLNHLKRGGRVSAATALFGSMLTIKPIIHVDDEGHLINVGKARGRKPSLMTLAAEMEKRAADPAEQTVFISHGDCLEDARLLADEIRTRMGVEKFVINDIGPVIGSHTGAGVIALFFLGSPR